MPILAEESQDQPLTYDAADSFTGGQSSFSRANRINADQATELVNLDIQRDGLLITRRGTSGLFGGALVANSADIQGLLYYSTPSMSLLMAVNDGSDYGQPTYFSWDGSTWTQLTAGHTELPTDDSVQVNIVQGIDMGYIADGIKGLITFDGTTLSAFGTGGSNPPIGNIMVWHTNRLFIAGTPTAPDQLAASDYLDGTHFDLQNYSIRVGADESDPITGLASWIDFNLVVLKRNSLWVVRTDPQIDTGQPYAGTWQTQVVHRTIGCVATRSVVQVGQDVWFLSDSGVRSVRRTIATDQNEVTEPISFPIQDVIDRINWSEAHKSCAVFWNNRVMFSVPLDSATAPNTVLVYNTLTQSWSGTWTGLNVLQFIKTEFNGERRLVMGCTSSRVLQWLDYVVPDNETDETFQDELAADDFFDIASSVTTRALTFNEIMSPKKGCNVSLEFHNSVADVSLAAILDQADPAPIVDDPFTTQNDQVTLPQTLPFNLPSNGVKRRAFDLLQFDPFQELQIKLSATSQKLAFRSLVASGFVETIELEQ